MSKSSIHITQIVLKPKDKPELGVMTPFTAELRESYKTVIKKVRGVLGKELVQVYVNVFSRQEFMNTLFHGAFKSFSMSWFYEGRSPTGYVYHAELDGVKYVFSKHTGGNEYMLWCSPEDLPAVFEQIGKFYQKSDWVKYGYGSLAPKSTWNPVPSDFYQRSDRHVTVSEYMRNH